ncbi:MAG: uroporphyrinogen-III synthase [Pseudomonadota bacterium]|nr:uroporphyrinogen-III synthase [Pseudomonadota bacterium]
MSRKTSNSPLNGKHILVTRPESQAESFVSLLRREGAIPVLLPTIETIPPDSWVSVDQAIASLEKYQWLIFTSVNGVNFFCNRFEDLNHNLSRLKHCNIISVGPKTSAALRKRGLESKIVAEKFQGEGILQALADTPVAGKYFLLPRALKAREILPETLRQRGAKVDVIMVYQTVFPQKSAGKINKLFTDQQNIDILTFTSSSAVSNLVNHCHEPLIAERIRQLPTACIGPITTATARELGLNVLIEASQYTVEGLIEAIKEWLKVKG